MSQQQKCPDCGGKGVIELLTSTVPCKKCLQSDAPIFEHAKSVGQLVAEKIEAQVLGIFAESWCGE